MNLQQLIDDTIIRLGEAQASLVAAYMPGNNASAPVQSSSQVITTWLNDAQNDLARNYYPISDTASYTWPAGQQFTRYSAFTCASGGSAFGVRKVNFGGVNLTSADRAATENWYPDMDTDPQGVPVYYYEDGVEGIGVYPIPAANTVVTAKAIIIPAPLVLPADVPVFPADRHVLLSWYAASMTLIRNTEDPVLQSRGNIMMQLYTKQATNILDRVWRLDPDFANDLMADNPAAAAPSPQGQ